MPPDRAVDEIDLSSLGLGESDFRDTPAEPPQLDPLVIDQLGLTAEDFADEPAIGEAPADDPQLNIIPHLPIQFRTSQIGQQLDRLGQAADRGISSIYNDPKGAAASGIETAGSAGGALAGGALAGGATEGLGASFGAAAGATGGEALARQFNKLVGLRDTTGREDLLDAGMSGAFNLAVPLVGKGYEAVAGAGRRVKQRAGAVGKVLNRPGSMAKAERVIVQEMKKGETFILESDLYKGGTRYDPQTRKFVDAPEGEAAPTLDAIKANIDNNLDTMLADRDSALTRIDKAAASYNANPDHAAKQIRGVAFNEVQGALRPLVQQMETFAKSPFTEPEAQGIGQVFQQLRASFDQLGLLGRSGAATPGVPDMANTLQAGELSPGQLNELVGNMYEALRGMRAFDKSVGAKALQDPSAFRQLEQNVGAVLGATKGLRDLRDKKIGEIFSKVGTVPELEGLSDVTVQGLNDGVHHLLTHNDALEQYMADLDVVENRARRTIDFPDAGITDFNRQGLARGGATKLLDMAGITPAAKTLRLMDRVPGKMNAIAEARMGSNAQPGMLERFAGTASSPYGIAAANLGKSMVSSGAARAMVEHGQQFGVRAPLQAPTEAQPVRMPRSIDGINKNFPSFIKQVEAITQDPNVVQQIQETFTERPDVEKIPMIGIMLRHFPELNQIFSPSKSGAPSEFEGKIHAEEDIGSIAQTIDESDLPVREKAIQWRSLFKDKKYDQGKIHRAPRRDF